MTPNGYFAKKQEVSCEFMLTARDILYPAAGRCDVKAPK